MNCDTKGIASLLEKSAEANHTPGIAVCLTDGEHREFFNFGLADVGDGAAMTENTVMPIGSCTKSFTAAAICILADRGLIGLDRPAAEYVPELRFADEYVSRSLTVRDALSHRCGLPRHDFAWAPYGQLTEDDILRKISVLKPFATFRERFCYQNLMYALCGIIIRRAGGMAWQDFVRENVTEKINMRTACFDVDGLLQKQPRALGYGYDYDSSRLTKTEYRRIGAMGPAGAMSASASDLARWIELHLAGGAAPCGRIISKELIGECHSPQTVIGSRDSGSLPGVDMTSYGLGWFIERYNGLKLIKHGGNVDGFSAMLFLVPELGFGGSILTNGSFDPTRDAVLYGLLDLAADRHDTDWPAYISAARDKFMQKQRDIQQDSSREAAPPFFAASIIGAFANPGYGVFTVSSEDGATVGRLGGFDFSIIPLGGFKFSLKPSRVGVAPVNAEFSADFSTLNIWFEPLLDEPIAFTRE